MQFSPRETKVVFLGAEKYTFLFWADELPENWDYTILHAALQAVRCDPSCATGYAPAEMLLGRQLVFPIEFKKKQVDFTGTKMTQPLVECLMRTHDKVFGKAAQNITAHQKMYKKKFDAKHKVKVFNLKKNSKVQVKIHRNKKAFSKFYVKWLPARSYYVIHKICHQKKKVILKTREGKILKRAKPFDKIRKFTGIL